MRLVEFHRYLNEDNALRVRFEVEHGIVLNLSFNWSAGSAKPAYLRQSCDTIPHMASPTVIGFTRMSNQVS